MEVISEHRLKRSRLMYHFEAALEYLISILVAGSFLATLTKELGISDSLTGILSSVISLGCLFQLLSLSITRTRVKRLVIVLSVTNQLLFMLLYLIPLTDLGKQTKIVLFVVLIFAAYFLYNIAHPKKINWLMSLVDEHHRGRFTANKEILSLIAGMVFSFGMGSVIDRLFEVGNRRLAFILSAAVIFVLMILHSITMLVATEKPMPSRPKINLRRSIGELAKNKIIWRIALVFVLYYLAIYVSTPFYGTYQIGELGLSLSFVSAITIGGSVSRILVSKFWGSYADRRSFAVMIEKCFLFLAAAQLFVMFAVPSNGKVMFIAYQLLYGIALGGINSALTNLVFEHVPNEQRADALAVTQALAGSAGFLVTLAVSPLVSFIQKNGNTLFGLPIYAQQAVTILAFLFTVSAIFYTRFAFIKTEKREYD